MSEQEIDEVEQLRRVGIGLVLGGLAFGGLSFGVEPTASGIALLVAGVVVWWGEHRRAVTVGIGLGVGVAGLLALVEVGSDTGFSERWLAGFLVASGVADYLLAPAYGKLRDAGERVSKR